MDLRISNRKIFQHNFIKNCLREIKKCGIKKKLALELISVAQSTNPTINNFPTRYARMTVSDFMKELNYSEKEIKTTLEKLTTPFDSMYSKGNQLFKKKVRGDKEFYYWNGNRGSEWSRFGYALPHIFDVNINTEIRKNLPENETIFTTVMLVMATRDMIPFTEKQIRVATGLTMYDIKKASKQIGFEIKAIQAGTSWFEKQSYNIEQQNLFRGFVFTDESVKRAEEFVEKSKMSFVWKGLFGLRMFFYMNKQSISKEYFSSHDITNQLNKFGKEFSLNSYENYVLLCKEQNTINSIALHRKASLDSDEFGNEKSQRFQESFIGGCRGAKKGHKDSLIVKKENCSQKSMEEEQPCSQPDVLLSQKDYADFVEAVRKIYEERKKTNFTVKCWKQLKEEVLEKVTNSSLSYKQHVIEHLNSIDNIYKAVKSPMFSENWFEPKEQMEIQIELSIEESQLQQLIPKMEQSDYERIMRECHVFCKANGDESYQTHLDELFKEKVFSEKQQKELRSLNQRSMLSQRELEFLNALSVLRARETK